MKKSIAMILAIMLLTLSATVLAEESILPAPQGMMESGRDKNGVPDREPPQEAAPDAQVFPGDGPAAAPENPNGEKPQDMPPEAGQFNGQPGSNPPAANGKPGGAPGAGMPAMIDFDALVSKGILSQETCDKIKAYMDAHQPANPTETDSETEKQQKEEPDVQTENPIGSTDPGNWLEDLLKEMLQNSVITQEEYDAIISAQ